MNTPTSPYTRKDERPIFYKSIEEMDKPLSELMEELRCEISRVRGKLSDIRRAYGWADRIEHLEGGLTCMVSAMYHTMEEWEGFEKKHKQKQAKLNQNAETKI